MVTKNLSTLKIHKLTQVQYERELSVGRIDENAVQTNNALTFKCSRTPYVDLMVNVLILD